ncbi:MAG TPA: DUF3467 domain-containing protein [Anaerolineales bacterium]|nr:DUF3467 domain-containing protein [Anaerolineales bacterium]HMV95176.1 DUF3467 domain-containing protein [Anaerolineales bacterium]HMX20197.1 DUF3467 domain-containing protein [Anaerolineales bacterium]HMX73931.1 DUF3467 domain-containing protein [Anaerolineales bacterium]HMZ42770.1 DUF3467 domain-containing protein [Anaerolineales bacterium]
MTTPPIPSKPTGPILELPADLELVYANLARIAHSPADIVLDFAHLLPGEPRAKIKSRVVMTPLSAKLLVRALTENIARYESAFGEINIPSNNSLADNLFRPFQQPPEPPKEP